MSARNTVLSVLQKANASQSAINSAFDNENISADKAEGKKDSKKKK